MRYSLLLSASASLIFASSASFAQVNSEEDDRFKPRVYGSLGVVGAVYSEGAKQHLGSTEIQSTASQIIRIEEPVPTNDTAIITQSEPLKIEAGIVKAQHIKPGDVSEEQYQRLLDEAERVRAFKGITTSSQTLETESVAKPLYEIQLFEAPESVSVAETASTITHSVIKGDTLYNISKRYNVDIADIQAANQIEGTAISLGQILSIPQSTRIVTETPMSENTTVTQPVLVSTEIINKAPETIKRVVLPVETQTNSVYAVLPKDTLYSISRRSCTNVTELMTQNGIKDPKTLKPGQTLTLPKGHCLAN